MLRDLLVPVYRGVEAVFLPLSRSFEFPSLFSSQGQGRSNASTYTSGGTILSKMSGGYIYIHPV